MDVILKDEMESSYIDYAMSVVVGRAIPDVRDGLKPVQRRIIYTMAENNWLSNSAHVKCARIVGSALGDYHPHGDLSVYNALVRMAQEFSLRYPLVDPQGNFGSIDGDEPAAYRYTEARLARISNELIEDLGRDTVDFIPNYDGRTVEPTCLPAKLPNILLNGTKGIAVGMATSMPPYNLMEVCAGIIATIDNPDISTEELMELIKGPDFPTGGIIMGTNGIYNSFSTGRGTIVVRGKIELEEKGSKGNKKQSLIITEIPYLLNKTSLVESIAKLIKDDVLKDVSDLRDESDRNGMRIVIDLKKDSQHQIVKNILYKRTRLQSRFHVTNLVLINEGKQPKILSMKELIEEYIHHRLNVIERRTKFDLKKAQKRLHKVEGLLIALQNIDKVIAIIKNSKDSTDAKEKLIDEFSFSETQVKAILSMPLSRLTNLEQQKLKDEQKELHEIIKELESILASKERRLTIIKTELSQLSKDFGDKRRTQIIEKDISNIKTIKRKDLIKKEPTIVILTKNQYIKRISLEEYRSQKRGGKGKKGMPVGEEDFIYDLFVCSTHDTILFFTSKGRVYSIKTFELTKQSRYAKGKPIVNHISLQEDEQISAMIPINNFQGEDFLIMTTKNGIIKKTALKLFENVRSTGLRAQKIKKDDRLISVKKLSNELQDIFIATKLGYAIRFDEEELREIGRNTMGVKGVDLREGDHVIDCLLVSPDDLILTITQNGYGQKTQVHEYRKTGRGAKGVINISLDREENDQVIAVKKSHDKDLLIGTEQGQVIRMSMEPIRVTHRKAKGVRMISLYEDDFVSAIGICPKEEIDDEEEEEKGEESITIENTLEITEENGEAFDDDDDDDDDSEEEDENEDEDEL